jgi:predicted metal-binding protein
MKKFNFVLLSLIYYRMEIDKPKIEQIIKDHGFEDFKWIYPGGIIISQWVRMKCMFGCTSYNANGTCPPNVPSVDDCKNKKDSRPNPESLAIDVFKTVSKYDFPINVLKDYNEIMNRYSILLVE